MSDTGIQLFDSKARMLPVDQIEAQITDDATRARFVAVRGAYDESEKIDVALTAKQDHLKALVVDLADAEAYRAKFWPTPTFHQLWRENFARK
jgi:hypothetical protein